MLIEPLFCRYQSAGYPLDEPTIVYMPHCDLHLYENLLRANCSRERLPRLLLIANRLSEYLDRCVPTLGCCVRPVHRAAPISVAGPS